MSTTTAPSPAASTPTAQPARTKGTPLAGLAAFARLDLKRQVRDKFAMFFIAGLPAFMYLVFGIGSDEKVGSGNVAMYVMVSMAAYGAVTATTSVAGTATLERTLGWGRQLALTPMSDLGFVLVKATLAMVVALVPATLIFVIGAATGAHGSTSDWLLCGLAVWAGSALFALFGLAISLFFQSGNSMGIASGSIVILAFLGNIFTPMSGLILDIGRFTPLYGYAGLARYPLTEGWLPNGEHDPLWLPIANVVAWTIIFSLIAMWGVRRSRERA